MCSRRDLLSLIPADAVYVAFLCLAVCLPACGPVAHGGEPDPKSKATAALALAQAQRERETDKTTRSHCYADPDVAAAVAVKAKAPLVLWVGMNCTDSGNAMKIRNDLSDAVHCHVPQWSGDRTPRVAITGQDGHEYFVPRDKISTETGGKLKAAWEGRPKVKPAEAVPVEVSRVAARKCATCGAWCDCGSGCACDEVVAKGPPKGLPAGLADTPEPPDPSAFVREWDRNVERAQAEGRKITVTLPGMAKPHTFHPDGRVFGSPPPPPVAPPKPAGGVPATRPPTTPATPARAVAARNTWSSGSTSTAHTPTGVPVVDLSGVISLPPVWVQDDCQGQP